jgi:hypothetical protein
MILSYCSARDFMSTVMDVPPPSLPPSSITPSSIPPMSPAAENTTVAAPESSGRKRTRSALKGLTLNDGSPEKRTAAGKPVRKQSRTINYSEDKENVMVE